MDDLIDVPRTVAVLNEILTAELSGVVRYTHYSLVITGPNRLPLVERETRWDIDPAHPFSAGIDESTALIHFGIGSSSPGRGRCRHLRTASARSTTPRTIWIVDDVSDALESVDVSAVSDNA